MSVYAQKYKYGYLSDPIRLDPITITEFYIPSHKIIISFGPDNNLDVFSANSPRNYIDHSMPDFLLDDFPEEKNTPPTVTQLHDIDLSLDYVEMVIEVSNIHKRLTSMEEKIKDKSKK